MRRSHPQSHVAFQCRGHVTNKKRYNSTFTRPMDPKLSRVVTQDERIPPTKSRDILITWQIKSIIFLLSKAYGPQTLQGGDLGWGKPTDKSRDTSKTWSRDKSKTLYLHFHKAYGWWLRMKGPHPQNQVTDQSSRHMTNQRCYISTFTRPMDAKPSRVVTWNENSTHKSRDTSTTWSLDK